MSKLWGSRFKKKTHPLVEKFTSSISYDYKLAKYDVLTSIAHAKMLGKTKIIPPKESAKIVTGLQSILRQVESGRFNFDKRAEDIHTNIQNALAKKIGSLAEKLHTARSRNDQVVTDLRMYAKEEIKHLQSKIKGAQLALVTLAKKNVEVIIPGFTHLQHAQPVSLAHHLLAYLEMLERDKDRLDDAYKRCDCLPLGAAALAGTSLPINRKLVAKLLGFSKICANSIDAVSDRDFVLEILADLSILAMHLSRMAEDFIFWASPEFALLQLDDACATGSSLMPQKKNPDVLELTRANAGSVYGNLLALLTTLKGLPLSYNRDMQLDKAPLFGSLETLSLNLEVLAELIRTAKVDHAQALIICSDEFLYATDLAEYLVKKGIAFKQAHNIVGELVVFALHKKIFLSEIPITQWKKFSSLFGKDVYKLLNSLTSVSRKRSSGGTNPDQVKRQLKNWLGSLRKHA
ncbi:MAG: argininosuccinate lyase [Candidatus Omnitrophica bacterium]|nr:argininosuccinate lyase [Candidatus Omnitrophota bacterium]